MERTSVSMPGNIKAVNYKTLDFSPLSEFLVATGLALRLLHLHRVRIVYQLLRDELNELLHGVIPLKKSKGSFYKPVASRYLIRKNSLVVSNAWR